MAILPKSESATTKASGTTLFRHAWILSDGKTGDLVQCRGVAQALGVQAEVRIVSPPKPWVWMMPYGPLPPSDRPHQKNSPIHQPLPDLVVASGWRTLAYIREIKKQRKTDVFTVFLKFPRVRSPYIDLVWVPEHDHLSGDNLITSIASPHELSPERLADEFAQKRDYLELLKKPLIGVLLGGNSKDYHFSDADCRRMAKALRALTNAGAGLAITPSRRSPENLKTAIRQELDGRSVYIWDEHEPNPYGYILSQADYFIVTADSANMVGEACVSGKPVFVFKPSGGSKKFDRLLDLFAAHGATKPLPDEIDVLTSWSYEPLFAAADIAREIERRAARQFKKS